MWFVVATLCFLTAAGDTDCSEERMPAAIPGSATQMECDLYAASIPVGEGDIPPGVQVIVLNPRCVRGSDA